MCSTKNRRMFRIWESTRYCVVEIPPDDGDRPGDRFGRLNWTQLVGAGGSEVVRR